MPDPASLDARRLTVPSGLPVVVQPGAKTGTVQLEIFDHAGVRVNFRHARWEPGTPTARRALERDASITEVDAAQIEEVALQVLQTLSERLAEAQRQQAAAAAAAQSQGTNEPVLVDMHSQVTGAHKSYPISTWNELYALLTGVASDSIFVSWPDARRFAVLDADFHIQTPDEATRARLARSLSPAPAAWHLTGRGFHALYHELEGFTARELAAAAAAQLALDPTVQIYRGTQEVLSRTRHPKSAHRGRVYGMVNPVLPTTAMSALAAFDDREVTPNERDETMNAFGWTLGKRFPHNACVIDPHHASAGDPVVVTEHGLYCFSCAGRTGTGLTSWGELRRRAGMPTAAAQSTQPVLDAIKHRVPHAVVSRYIEAIAPQLPLKYHRDLHSAMLKRLHGTTTEDVMLNAAVFHAWGYARGRGNRWIHVDSLQLVSPRPDRAVASHCSAAQMVATTKEGDLVLKPDPARVSRLVSDGTVPGWTPLLSSALAPIWHIHNAARPGLLLVQPRDPARRVVRYIAPGERIPMEEAQARIAARFPGINFSYLTLLHVARGFGEQGTCQLPVIWATGITSTGKTSHVYVEGAMHDETPENLVVGPESTERLTDMLGEAQSRTGFVMLDDFAKNLSGRDGQRVLDNILTFVLQLNRTVTYHHRHVGMVASHIRTPLVLADMREPGKLRQSEQFGRRVVMVKLEQQVRWDGVKGNSGFTHWWGETDELRTAAESWHSHIIDTYFPSGAPMSFLGLAQKLGFQTAAEYFGQGTERDGQQELVRQFVTALLQAPEASAAFQQAIGKGMVEIPLGALGPVTTHADMLCGIYGSEGVTARDLIAALEPYQGVLHQLLPFREPVHVDVSHHGRKVFARVRAAQRRHRSAGAYNAGLLAEGATPLNMLHPGWTQAGAA